MLSVVHSTALNNRMISTWWNEKEFWSVHDLISGSCVVFIWRNRRKLDRHKLAGVKFKIQTTRLQAGSQKQYCSSQFAQYPCVHFCILACMRLSNASFQQSPMPA